MLGQKRAVIRELIYIGIILCCLGFIVASLFGRRGWLSLREKEARYESLLRDVDRLKRENDQLKERVDKLQKDPGTVEDEIRRKMMYAKPGEKIYQVTPPKEAP
jgi:cell division protein FtsB